MDDVRSTAGPCWMKNRSHHGDAVIIKVIMNDCAKAEDQSLVSFRDYLNTKSSNLASGLSFVISQNPGRQRSGVRTLYVTNQLAYNIH